MQTKERVGIYAITTGIGMFLTGIVLIGIPLY